MYIDNVSFLEHYKLTCLFTLAIWLHTIIYIISKNDQWNFTFKLIFTDITEKICHQSFGPICCMFYETSVTVNAVLSTYYYEL